MSREGALLAARFSFMPNRLGYCGPEENRALLEYAAANQSDRGLERILSRFAGAFPYYSFIAASNGIADPLDLRVVEAYWIGNELLATVEMADFARHLADRFERRFPRRLLEQVIGQVPAGARPHHNFHVLNVPIRAGHLEVALSLETMDECRISWGRVAADQGDTLLVERAPLQRQGDDLALGAPTPRRVFRRFDGKTLLDDVPAGGHVAVHWGCACYALSPRQLRHLERLTAHHLRLANESRRRAALEG